MQRENRPSGILRAKAIRPPKRPPVRNVMDAIRYGTPSIFAPRRAQWQRANAEIFERSIADQEAADRSPLISLIGHLWLARLDLDGRIHDYGLASCRVVTTAGVGFIVDAFQGLVEPEIMKYHGIGTGAASEAVGNTGLTTELTTQYSVDNTRASGTLGEQAGNANVFETTATITVDSSVSITEHGVFSQAATGGGVMIDRSVFSAVPLASGESLLATYDLTFTAGG